MWRAVRAATMFIRRKRYVLSPYNFNVAEAIGLHMTRRHNIYAAHVRIFTMQPAMR